MAPGRIGERTAARLYGGLWGILVEWLRVPDQPPRLPGPAGEGHEAVRPAPGFLRYLKFWFWIALLPVDIALVVPWLVVLFIWPWVGVLLAVPVWALAVLPDIAAYIAVHLRYDSTWYLFTDRAMRMRRGVWVIDEVTITYENIQNVTVLQGPVQRWFGIANVVVQTAGGGGERGPHGRRAGGHVGLIEGVSDAPALRDRIMERVRKSRTAGLGDERDAAGAPAPGLVGSPAVREVLGEIREAAARLAADRA